MCRTQSYKLWVELFWKRFLMLVVSFKTESSIESLVHWMGDDSMPVMPNIITLKPHTFYEISIKSWNRLNRVPPFDSNICLELHLYQKCFFNALALAMLIRENQRSKRHFILVGYFTMECMHFTMNHYSPR